MRDENKELFIPMSELRQCSDEQLQDVIDETKQNLETIRHQSAIMGTPTAQHHRIRGSKKLIARCNTILRERGYHG